jgi:hypothetical protein
VSAVPHTRDSPVARLAGPSAGGRCRGSSRAPRFAAVAGAGGVLAARRGPRRPATASRCCSRGGAATVVDTRGAAGWDEHQRSLIATVRLLRLPGDADGGEGLAADLARTSGESVVAPRSSSLALALLLDQGGSVGRQPSRPSPGCLRCIGLVEASFDAFVVDARRPDFVLRRTWRGRTACLPSGRPGVLWCLFSGLGGLARSRALFALDPRGTGRSDPPGSPDAYALDDYVADLVRVQDQLGID